MSFFHLSAIPLRIYLMLVLLLLVFPVLIASGLVSYRATRASLQEEAFASLETAADAYRDDLLTVLNHKHERATATLTEIELGCDVSGRMNGICARETLRAFVKAEAAQGAVLTDRHGRRLPLGNVAALATPPVSPLGTFNATSSGVSITTRNTNPDSGLSLAASYAARQLTPPPQLRRGTLLLALVDGQERPLAGDAEDLPSLSSRAADLRACLAGKDFVMTVHPGAPQAIYAALRNVPAVGGACVVSYVPAADVLGPADRLRRKMTQLSLGFAFAAIVLAYIVAFALTRPLFRLRQRVLGLQAGDFDSPVPVTGVGELREFSQAFASMAEAIRISRQALVTSERRLRLAYASAQLWVWEYNLRSGIIHWRNPSPAASPMRASSARSGVRMLGDTQMRLRQFVNLIHPNDRHAAIEAIRAAGKSKTYESEYRLRTPYGDYIWLASWGHVVQERESGGDIMIGVSREITEQKRAEQLAREADRLAATSQMAAALAHEINNPLTSVMGAVHVASAQPEDTPQLRKLLGIAENESRRIAHIVRQLLGLYRPALPTARVDLTALLESVLAISARAVSRKRQHTYVSIERGLAIEGYADELRHAFTNVIINAAESAPEGGRIAVRAHRGRAWDNGSARGIRVLVCDNGPGIPPDTLARVMEPFVGTKPTRGTGLGLWVTRSVVLNHGGHLRVRTCRGPHSGTSVLIYLPEKT